MILHTSAFLSTCIPACEDVYLHRGKDDVNLIVWLLLFTHLLIYVRCYCRDILFVVHVYNECLSPGLEMHNVGLKADCLVSKNVDSQSCTCWLHYPDGLNLLIFTVRKLLVLFLPSLLLLWLYRIFLFLFLMMKKISMDHLVFIHRKEKGCGRENLRKISMAHLVFSHGKPWKGNKRYEH